MSESAEADPLKRMRARITQCRMLANALSEPTASALLRQVADKSESDLRKLGAERERQKS